MSKKTKQSDDALIAVLPCIHAPITPPKVWEWAMTELQGMADTGRLTHVVQPGDWLDMDAASSHAENYEHDQNEEYECVAKQSRMIRGIVGSKVRLIRHDGNHEARLEPGSTNPIPKRLARLGHWTRDPDLSKEWGKWWWVPYHRSAKGVTKIGQVCIWHGFDISSNSDELEAIEIANLMGGHPNLLLVRAHTHRPIEVTQCMRTKKVSLPWWYMNAGHLGPSNPPYMRRNSTLMWGQAMVAIEAKLTYDLNSGREWAAELKRYPGGKQHEEDPLLVQGLHPYQLQDILKAPKPRPRRRPARNRR